MAHNYVDASIEALKQLRDALTPSGMHLTNIKEFQESEFGKDKTIALTITVHVPAKHYFVDSSSLSRDKKS